MSTHNTISDEIIIAYIEGNLDDVKSSEIEKILREDDKEFMRMVDFCHSYAEMEETEFEVIPCRFQSNHLINMLDYTQKNKN